LGAEHLLMGSASQFSVHSKSIREPLERRESIQSEMMEKHSEKSGALSHRKSEVSGTPFKVINLLP